MDKGYCEFLPTMGWRAHAGLSKFLGSRPGAGMNPPRWGLEKGAIFTDFNRLSSTQAGFI
jgi:hypothetical protein